VYTCIYAMHTEPPVVCGAESHVRANASVSIPESGSLSLETGREPLECILSPGAVIEFEIYGFNRD